MARPVRKARGQPRAGPVDRRRLALVAALSLAVASGLVAAVWLVAGGAPAHWDLVRPEMLVGGLLGSTSPALASVASRLSQSTRFVPTALWVITGVAALVVGPACALMANFAVSLYAGDWLNGSAANAFLLGFLTGAAGWRWARAAPVPQVTGPSS